MHSEAQTFDFVIVGGGSAGCVLANRLSHSGRYTVCVLEAGPPDRSFLIRMPSGVIQLMKSKTLNWAFRTEPQSQLNNRCIFWPRGKTLGGSSSINTTCYVRGHAADYDHWAALGNAGWSYSDMLPYFKRSEHYTVGPMNQFHGIGGELTVGRLKYTNHLSQVCLDAAAQAGHLRNEDFNGASQDGFGWSDVNQINGQRCSNARAFLNPALGRRNLSIVTQARVTKLVFDQTASGRVKRCTGVQLHEKKGARMIYARREVLLCGGAVNSPQLLMLSGVGNAEELAPHGITLVHHLPGVGKNLQDHLDVNIIHRETTRHATSFHPSYAWRGIKSVWSYFARRTGPLTSNIAEVTGFARSSASETMPDLEFHFQPVINQDQGFDTSNLRRYYGYSLMVYDLRPKSRGYISLRSADPLVDPVIQPNYLADPRDLKKLIQGVKMARKVLAQNAFTPYRGLEIQPGEEVQDDQDIEKFIRAKAQTDYHPVGTCKMGGDPMAVVDERLRVHGLRNIRVVDASIMPTLIGGNTNAPVTAIAEKAADMILSDAEHQQHEENLSV